MRNINLNISSTCVHNYFHGQPSTSYLSLLSLGLQLITVDAKSVNASEGTQVRFACQTSFSQDDVTLAFASMLPPNTSLQGLTSSFSGLPDGGHERSISFIATAALNETMIVCHATNKTNEDHTEVGVPALLLVQGKYVLREIVH